MRPNPTPRSAPTYPGSEQAAARYLTIPLRPGGAASILALGFNGILLLGGVTATVLGALHVAVRGNGVLIVLGAILSVPGALIGALLFAGSGKQLTDTAIVLGVRWHRRIIPLESIAAAGLIYHIGGRLSGWMPFVWLDDGKPIALPLGISMTPDPRKPDGTVADWADVAVSRQAQICYEIYERARAVQGDDGPVTTQSQVIYRGGGKRSREKAYWSAHPGVIALLPSS